ESSISDMSKASQERYSQPLYSLFFFYCFLICFKSFHNTSVMQLIGQIMSHMHAAIFILVSRHQGLFLCLYPNFDIKHKTTSRIFIFCFFFPLCLPDAGPPPTAPFDHRIVTPKPHQIATYYTINRDEVLGGGRFGQVYKCLENSSGLTLAAKIIKAKSQKEKEVVRNEIQVMNQLNHANLIQLYAAFESRNDIILVMEYVEGGELFDRIIDENYNLTELDTVLFIRQICEGLQYMHKNYILHLDLKPENILCVSRATNKIKIIDFGLARRYKPREKLRVNFGTPEFLAPEVINYEFVSFPTDMWSLGVITYMLLSGLSPFLGDDDNETLNNILACQWNFEEEEFGDISDEAKDFITRLLVKSKSWRMSATESLRHGWLSDPSLHYRLNQKVIRGPSFQKATFDHSISQALCSRFLL
uniref:Myosin light chain kinase family member 4 n=1 Tax=Fundulus heteroclitus TaxID=8078 RepID=A0A3Q2SZP3_FUNHE